LMNAPIVSTITPSPVEFQFMMVLSVIVSEFTL